MENVIVEYSDFTKENSYVERITFEILTDVTLVLEQSTTMTDDTTTSEVNITMTDVGGETVVSGTLDAETINALIRSLSILKSQISSS